MSTTQSTRQRVSRFAAPIVAVILLYGCVFYIPLQRTLTDRLAKQHKLEEVVRRRGQEHTSRLRQLATVEADERSLVNQLDATRQSGEHLVTRRADRRDEMFATTSPASLLAQTLERLTRHRLTCLDSSPIEASTKSRGEPRAALKPVADLLGVMPGTETARCEVRLTLSGRFQDLHEAMREIQRELTGLFIVALEMQASDGRADRHVWILTISV